MVENRGQEHWWELGSMRNSRAFRCSGRGDQNGFRMPLLSKIFYLPIYRRRGVPGGLDILNPLGWSWQFLWVYYNPYSGYFRFENVYHQMGSWVLSECETSFEPTRLSGISVRCAQLFLAVLKEINGPPIRSCLRIFPWPSFLLSFLEEAKVIFTWAQVIFIRLELITLMDLYI